MKIIKKTLFLLMILFVYSAKTFSDITVSEYIELFSDSAPMQMWQTSDWYSVDTKISSFEQQKLVYDEYEISNDFFNYIDYSAPETTKLICQQNYYFVSIFQEQNVDFSVIYKDTYNITPFDGFPKVIYWPEGSQNAVSLTLDLIEKRNDGWFYQKQVKLEPGSYNYKYTFASSQVPDGYSLEISSFVVCRRPNGCINLNMKQSAIVSNAKVLLQWSMSVPTNEATAYKVYLGTDLENMQPVYDGLKTYYEILGLDYGKQYFWQIEAKNNYGISSKSQIFKFSTINKITKAYNYPNPFNPALGQKTNILFDMSDNGSAKLSVYSEFGDLCWEKVFDNLVKGANEVTYNGKDDNEKVLFNGTYLCVINKKYSNKEEKDKCRILIIK